MSIGTVEPIEQHIFTVTELNTLANAQLSQLVMRVKGEVSDFRKNNKFVYFDLKDDASRVNCFMMDFQLGVALENGMEVIASGSPGVYVPYGKYTFRVRTVEPVGEGALNRAFELLKKQLEAEGLFANERKRLLPRFPERIGLVTSKDAAAYTDFLRILRNRWGGVEVCFRNARVQGEDAAEDIVRALAAFNSHTPSVDVIAVVRGGGSLEDLHAFNDERVVRAIAASRAPTVSGIGHERDVTLSDFAADVRASTPSNAAERIVPNRDEIEGELAGFSLALDAAVERRMRGARDLIARAERVTDAFVRSRVRAMEHLALNMQSAFTAYMNHWRMEISNKEKLLVSYNPRNVLARGYTITRKGGILVKDAFSLSRGDEIETEMHTGSVKSRIQ